MLVGRPTRLPGWSHLHRQTARTNRRVRQVPAGQERPPGSGVRPRANAKARRASAITILHSGSLLRRYLRETSTMSQRTGQAEEGRIVDGNISADSETVRASA